jgi:hypothetical protein
MRKSFTAVVLVVGMALGSVLTMVLNPVGAASALVSGSSAKGSHESVLQQALDTLVGKGTITQAQANDVTNQVQADRNARYAKLPHIGAKVFAEVAAALKMDPKALRQELASGKSIAQVATSKGVNPSTLASQITSGLEQQINARVSGHKVAQQFATTMEQNLPTRVNAFLNRVWGRHHAKASTPATSGTSATTSTTSH